MRELDKQRFHKNYLLIFPNLQIFTQKSRLGEDWDVGFGYCAVAAFDVDYVVDAA